MPEPDSGLPVQPPQPSSEASSASEPGTTSPNATSTTKQKGRFNWQLVVRSAVWLALAVWILGGRVGKFFGLTMPWSLSARVGVLAGVVLVGQLVAFSARKGLRYMGQVLMLALWPFWAPIKLAYYILRGLSIPAAAARKALGLLRRFCMGLAGKISLMVAVVVTVWAIYRTTGRTLLWVEIALLAFFFALLLVSFFHLATRPFFLMERRLGFWHWVVSKMQSSARKELAQVGQEEKASKGWTWPLLYSTAWVRMQKDTLVWCNRNNLTCD